MKTLPTRLAFHGALVLLAGMIAGMPYGIAIVEQWGDAPIAAWKLAHQEGLLNGILMLVFAALLFQLSLGKRVSGTIFWSLLICGYGNILGSIIAAASGYRGIMPTGPLLNWLVFIPFNAAVIAAFVAVLAFLVGCYRARGQ